jgi:hypothetical protein
MEVRHFMGNGIEMQIQRSRWLSSAQASLTERAMTKIAALQCLSQTAFDALSRPDLWHPVVQSVVWQGFAVSVALAYAVFPLAIVTILLLVIGVDERVIRLLLIIATYSVPGLIVWALIKN